LVKTFNLAIFLQKIRQMQKRVDIIQNDPEVPAGVFGELLTEWQVPFRILRPDQGDALPDRANAVIVLGGVMGVHDDNSCPFLPVVKAALARLLANGTPLFGICLGGQLLADVAGGVVSSNRCGEKGLVEVTLTAAGASDRMFAGIDRSFPVFEWHNDSFMIPPEAELLAFSSVCQGQAFRIGNALGVQFHPEVNTTIVADWSRRDSNRLQLTGSFAVAEADHRALARQLLANFLVIAGIRAHGRK
jgi:GMP synthase-like glutamine amidotransferase